MRAFPTTVEECERYLLDLAGRGGSSPMPIPTRASNLGPCSEASLVQLIITWASRQSRPILYTYAQDGNDEQLAELVRRQYGVIAALLCASAKARRPAIDVTTQLKAAAISSMYTRLTDAFKRDSIDVDEAGGAVNRSARGRGAELLCFDHLDLGAPPPFYYTDENGYRVLRDLRGFTQLTNRIFERLVPSFYKRNFSQEFKNAIGAFAFELVSNTHDHARTNLGGHELLMSVRGLYARHYEMTPDRYVSISEGFGPLRDYFRRVLVPEDGIHQQVVELSVFDSGPGMAQRWTGRSLGDLSSEEELQAVLDCFLEGTTTKSLRMFGAGLPLVVALLAAHDGMIRVRTGRVSLFLDAAKDTSTTVPSLSQWRLPTAPSLAPVIGTLVSIIVPIPRAGI